MKNKLLNFVLIILFAFFFILFYLLYFHKKNILPDISKTITPSPICKINPLPIIKYQLNNKTYTLLVASNPFQWEKGLMFYKNKSDLEGADGMIFKFPDKQIRTFWNKNTFMDLDVYWLDDDRIVGKSYLPSIEKSKEIVVVKSPKEVNKVIEIVVSC